MARLLAPAFVRFAILFAFVSIPAAAGAETVAELQDYPPDDLQIVGFELPRAASVEIEAVGARRRGSDHLVVYAWLLDASTRKLVWSQEHGDQNRVSGSRTLRRTRDTLQMAAGRYELYAWAGTRTPVRWGSEDDFFGRRGIVIMRGPSDRDSREVERSLRDCYVRVETAALSKNEVTRFEPTGEMPGALYRATRLGNNACVRGTFTLDRAGDVRVYCLGEIPSSADAFADGAWIVDTATRERVWELRRRQTRQAGGVDKNRLFDDTVHLDAGHYLVVAGTDGSHAWNEWNGAPPDDPLNWGISILPGRDLGSTAFHLDTTWSRDEPLLALTRIGDDETMERRFRLAAETTLQIYAVGEKGGDWDEFADRGWITNAANGGVVWEMTTGNTVAAGGAEKNRMFDGTVKLPAGDYVVHFETDGSHSYDDWNADAPFDAEGWGLAIYAAPGGQAGGFALLEDTRGGRGRASHGGSGGGAALADLTEVGDDADVRAEFTLDQPGPIHIYAVGEGLEREMYDYGWIENATTGRTVWEMTMRNTRHAGGARKNRVFDDEVMLDAGKYVVRFQTDGSHAYGDWNDRRPPDPHGWGITVTQTGRSRGTPER